MTSKYTFLYNAQIEALLDSFIENLSKRVSCSDVAKYIEFVILGGGYGRGEGGILQSKNSCKLYNDLDFFVLIRNDVSKAKTLEINAFFKELSKQLEPLVEIDVDFSNAVKISYVKKRLNLMSWREMALGGNVVFGDQQNFKKLFSIKEEDNNIPCSEIVKLAMNRYSGLVFAYERLLSTRVLTDTDKDFIARNINKALLACGDIYLATKKNLPFKTLDRLKTIENVVENTNWQELVELYKQAVAFKISPNFDFTRQTFEDRLFQARKMLDKTFLHYSCLHNNYSILDKIKNIIKLFKLRKLFKRISYDKIRYKKSFDPKEKLLFIASTILVKENNHQNTEIFTIYKKIWERLA